MFSSEKRYVSRVTIPTVIAGVVMLIVYLSFNAGVTDDMEMDAQPFDPSMITETYTDAEKQQEIQALEMSLNNLDQVLRGDSVENASAETMKAIDAQRQKAEQSIADLKEASEGEWRNALSAAYAEVNAYSEVVGDTLDSNGALAQN